ncbi:MAG TPA: anti-sigma regulatory factor [Candidatus Polarisedimenticolaceae bacterium]|nr:anti-sigma regulatory factor [Candidatus Polarisedimenticolaceae bacterium]
MSAAIPEDVEEDLHIRTDADIVTARRRGRLLAERSGFGATDQVLITTAISELARNLLLYAHGGRIALRQVVNREVNGVTVIASDDGPGIADVDRAMEPGYSTSSSLGLGLPGVKRLMDEMSIETQVGVGTTVTATKWKR